MKYFSSSILLLCSFFCLAQPNFNPINKAEFAPNEPQYLSINGDKKFESIQDLTVHLESKYLDQTIGDQTLQYVYTKNSPIGTHYTFEHRFKNKPIYQSSIQASFNKKGQLILVANNLVTFNDFTNQNSATEKGKFWIKNTNGLTLGFKILEWDSISKNYTSHYYDLNNRLILTHNPRLYFHAPDSVISAMVYLPNPIVATNQIYGGPYADNGDKNNTELTNARSKVSFSLKYTNGKLILADSLIQIKDLNTPKIEVIQPADSFLNFTRDQSGFEDVNVFYHLSTYSNYLRKIGFSNLLDSLLVDPHGANGDDNSFIETEKYPYEIEYGTGNVDDGEDGQVVVHEFSHAMSVIAAPKTTAGKDRLAMEEGQADYVTMTYSRSLSPNKTNQVFSWDGHNEFWSGFKTNAPLLYKNRKGFEDIDREIWSTALMCIHDKLRNTKSDSLIFSSYFLQSSNSSMPQMARIILKIDSLLFSGKDVGKIWQCFTNQGILDTVPDNIGLTFANLDQIKILNTYEFSQGIGMAIISISNPNFWTDFEIFNSVGQKLITQNVSAEIGLNPDDFKPGVYFIKLKSKQGQLNAVYKLVRY